MCVCLRAGDQDAVNGGLVVHTVLASAADVQLLRRNLRRNQPVSPITAGIIQLNSVHSRSVICIVTCKVSYASCYHSNTVTQYLLMNVTNAQTLKKGTRNETEVMEN